VPQGGGRHPVSGDPRSSVDSVKETVLMNCHLHGAFGDTAVSQQLIKVLSE